MPKFKEPGFKTRHRQAVDAKFGIKPVPCPAPRGTLMLTPWALRPQARGQNRWNGVYDHPKLPPSWRELFNGSEAYVAKLRKRGYKRLGGGFYSAVYAIEGSDRVIKVCHQGDDCWPLFAEWAQANPSPFVPVIHSFKRHKGFYVAVIERLDMTVEAADRSSGQGLDHVTTHFATYTKGKVPKGPISQAMMATAFSFFPGLREVLDRMREEFSGHARFDMHNENWMLRKDGSLVITDPLAGTESDKARAKVSQITRLKGTQARIAA